MAHSNELRARARDYFEIHGKTLSEISEQLKIPISTLSEWKNDITQPFSIWKKGRFKERIDTASQKMNDEIRNSDAFRELEERLKKEYRVERYNACGQYIINEGEDGKIARQRAEAIILSAMSMDYLDAKAHDGLEVATELLNDMKRNPENAKMGDVKMYVDIVRTVKEMRFGKSPDTVIFNQNNQGEFSEESLATMSTEQLRRVIEERRKEKVSLEAKALMES